MADAEGVTVGQLVADARRQLTGAGIEAGPAATEAVDLVGHATGWSRTEVALRRRERIAADDPLPMRVRELVSRRADREPLQHIIGTAPFGPLELLVGPGVFIPRPETEVLGEWARQHLTQLVSAGVPRPRVVDLCTGSGALALLLADAIPAAVITGVEADPAALEWASRNVEACTRRWVGGPGREVEVIRGDATDPELLRPWWGRVDVIVANPPYVPRSTAVAAEVHADPAQAVFGGADGLAVIGPMMIPVTALLVPGGVVGVEHDDDGGAGVRELMQATGQLAEIRTHRDLAGRDRFTTAVKAHTTDSHHG